MIERCDLQTLWLVRHGESLGNVADRRAHTQHSRTVDTDVRDPDVELSPTGEQQARALGQWFAEVELRDGRPDAAVTSPYRRATQTASLLLANLGTVDRDRDERLRERDLGLLDGLTRLGVEERYADEAARRERLGKFYYRPPGGESWCDVALRVRAVLGSLSARFPGQRVLVVSHQAVIMLARYALEGLDEEQVLELDRTAPLSNCGVTRYDRSSPSGTAPPTLQLTYADRTDGLRRGDAPETLEPDAASLSDADG